MTSQRGFAVSHQKVALELSFDGLLAGYTELTITPDNKNLRTVHLNLRQASIQKVTCAGVPSDYSYNDLLSSVSLSDPTNVHLYPELQRKIFTAASDGSGGELSILLPPQARPQALGRASVPLESDTTADSVGPLEAPTPETASSSQELAPIVIRIDYYVRDPTDGMQFVRPTQEAPFRIPHLFTSPTCPDAARCWVPCVDSLWERCTWELEFVVPKYLDSLEEGEGFNSSSGSKGDLNEGKVLVVCSGDLVEEVTHPQSQSKTIFYYSQSVATSVQHIAFAAGPFVLQKLSLQGRLGNNSTTAIDASTQPPILGFCLPGREEEMAHSIGFTIQALDFYSRNYGSYPFGSFKLLFIEEPVVDVHNASSLAICSSDLLHPPTVIDQALETRQLFSHAIAFQWFGVNIIQKAWADTWVINGLSMYVTGLFLRKLMGNNEYRFRLKKDMDRLCAWDLNMPPLYQQGSVEPPDSQLLAFINLKAPLVLHILDRRMRKVSASLGLGRVIPKIVLQAMTGELPNNALSARMFLRTCAKVSGADLQSFSHQWIEGSGCPRFVCSAQFNRKKLHIEMTVRQELPAVQFAAARPEEAIHTNPVPFFEGQMTARIHEPDGTPYEHVLDIKGFTSRYEVPFNTKYKRVRRNTKRFQARLAAAAAAAEGDEDAAEAMGMIDLGFGLGMWENEDEREKWKVADWTEEDDVNMATASYEWIRMDAEFEWLATIHFDQPDFMWVSQLERDRDVVAQVSAVHALGARPNAIASTMLTRTALVSKYFYRVRTEAIHALVNCAIPQLDYIGLFHLLMLFRSKYCYEPSSEDFAGKDPLDLPCFPRPNDFSNAPEYFVQRALIHAIARVRSERGQTLLQVKRFLLTVLRYNDNSSNRFVDDYYLAALVTALAGALLPTDSDFIGGYITPSEDSEAQGEDEIISAATAEVTRLQELDRLVPSYHNLITLAAIDYRTALTLSNQIPLDLPHFLAYTRQGSYPPVRIAAFSSLLLFRGLQHKVLTRYMFAVLSSDENRIVRRALARSMCEALAISLATGEFGSSGGRGPEALLIEDDGYSRFDETDKEIQIESMLRGLKREVGRSAAVREGFLSALLASTIDSEARWALLKLGELLFKPAEEFDLPYKPKVSLRMRMPSTPMTAMMPPTPSAESSNPIRIKLLKSAAGNKEAEAAIAPPRVAFEAANASDTRRLKLVKAKKPKPLQEAQASGMSSADLSACRNCLKKLSENRNALPFLNPVDPVRDHAPNYFEVIPEPMDLGSMGNKLNAGQYADRFAFRADFELMVRNARTYTPDPKAAVHVAANALEKGFNSHWARITKTLEQTAAKHAKQAELSAANAALPTAPHVVVANTNGHARETPSGHLAALNGAPSAPTDARTSATPQPTRLGLKLKIKPRASNGPLSGVPETPTAFATTAAGPAPASLPSPSAPKIKLGGNKARSNPPHEKSIGAATVPSSAVEIDAPLPVDYDEQLVMTSDSGLEGFDAFAHSAGLRIHVKRCKAFLQMLKKMPEAFFFLKPVDPVKDGAPTYLDEIKHPMDLSTMERKLSSSAYKTMNEFASDMLLVFSNCRQFNPVGTIPVQYAAVLERVFAREWPKMCERKLDASDSRAAKAALTKLRGDPVRYSSGLFLEPVDPVALGIPTYFEVVQPQDARDLRTIADKLKAGAYGTLDDMDDDVRLMLHNCRTFNRADPIVCGLADAFEKAYEKEMKPIRASVHGSTLQSGGATKRKEVAEKGEQEGEGEGASKKARFG